MESKENMRVALDQHRLDEALQALNRALEIDPQDANAYKNRGNVYGKLNRLAEALQDYTIAIKLAPQDANAYKSRGNVYGKLNRLEEALQDYNRALEIDPHFVLAQNNQKQLLNSMKAAEKSPKSSLTLVASAGGDDQTPCLLVRTEDSSTDWKTDALPIARLVDLPVARPVDLPVSAASIRDALGTAINNYEAQFQSPRITFSVFHGGASSTQAIRDLRSNLGNCQNNLPNIFNVLFTHFSTSVSGMRPDSLDTKLIDVLLQVPHIKTVYDRKALDTQ